MFFDNLYGIIFRKKRGDKVFARINSMGLFGIDSYMVGVEVDYRGFRESMLSVCPIPPLTNPATEFAPQSKTAATNFRRAELR